MVNVRSKPTSTDGKVLQYIAGLGSAQCCPVDNLKPHQFANFELQVRACGIKPEMLDFGLTQLHFKIRILEFFLELSYKLTFKKNVCSKKYKDDYNKNKKRILGELKEKLGLNVSVPTSGGRGNSNTGELANRVFENYQVFAEITKLDEEMIRLVHIVICVLNQPYAINTEKLSVILTQIREIYYAKYSWKMISVSFHRFLDHTIDVINVLPLPPGMYTEQAGEALNKYLRKFR